MSALDAGARPDSAAGWGPEHSWTGTPPLELHYVTFETLFAP